MCDAKETSHCYRYMFIEMLDSTFHGISRDIGYAVKNCNTDDYAVIDQIVVDTFNKTEKPDEVSQNFQDWHRSWTWSGG